MDDFGVNTGYVADLFERFQDDPSSVDEVWRDYFVAHPPDFVAPAVSPKRNAQPSASPAAAAQAPAAAAPTARPAPSKGNGVAWDPGGLAELLAPVATSPSDTVMQGRVAQLINAYRVRGHLFAHVDPLHAPPAKPPELELARFGLGPADLDGAYSTVDMAGPQTATLGEIIARLEETYCRSIGVEFTHIDQPEMRSWLQARMEATQNRLTLTRDEQIRILTKLTDAETLEQFIHKNYVGAKRFSLEGAESLIPLCDLLVESAGAAGVEEIVIGMAHRGRLNVLANILDKSVREIFAAFEDDEPEKFMGRGDVKYHQGYSTDHRTSSGNAVHLTLAFNPSHLEWVNPVVEGRVRAKQDRRGDRDRRRVMPLLIHGDAAFMGQGVNAETLNLMGLEGYETGGTIHVVVNNQIGFTTLPGDSRSTRYATDITRMLKVPVFHVNGEDPEAVAQVTALSIDFRQRFGKDVVVDMYCYRRYGHNEADEPRFTQPSMYALIDERPGVRAVYVQRLLEMGQITKPQANEIALTRRQALEAALVEAKRGGFTPSPNAMGGLWRPYVGGPDAASPEVPTSLPREQLVALAKRAVAIPEGFRANPKVARLLAARIDRLEKGQPVDWATGEMLAYASLLDQGVRVRLSGQDARRGTFSHRHATLHDAQTGQAYTPLSNLGAGAARFEVWDSPLSESGVLGFEYGYSLDQPDGLVIWEAQFGDFANCAQVIIDQFIVSGEDKWHRLSGLVLYLPHGFEGQGPEHSSARLERFLQLAAEDNVQVVNLTTPAQLFHAIRRQIVRPWRKPLVVMTPKSKLREQNATIDDFVSGSFQRVIGDPSVEPDKATSVLLCSGRVYFDLVAERKRLGADTHAIVRLEQLYPLSGELARVLAPYRAGTPLVWVQDEPSNMGAWYYLNARLPGLIGDRLPLGVVSRAESASPATGSHSSHDLEQKMLLEAAFGRK